MNLIKKGVIKPNHCFFFCWRVTSCKLQDKSRVQMRLDEGIISIVCFPCHSLVITQRLIKAITQSKVLVSLNNHQLLRSPTELGTWERQTMRQIYIFDKMPIFF